MNSLQEIQILLIPDREHKVLQDIFVVGFCNGKSLKEIFWLQQNYQMLEKQEGLTYMEKSVRCMT